MTLEQQYEKETGRKAEVLDEGYVPSTGFVEWLKPQIPRWIPVEERLPEEEIDVLVFNGESVRCVELRDGEYLIHGEYSVEGVTHWMPIPSPPEKNTERKDI